MPSRALLLTAIEAAETIGAGDEEEASKLRRPSNEAQGDATVSGEGEALDRLLDDAPAGASPTRSLPPAATGPPPTFAPRRRSSSSLTRRSPRTDFELALRGLEDGLMVEGCWPEPSAAATADGKPSPSPAAATREETPSSDGLPDDGELEAD